MTEISIIVPVYNSEKYLKETIGSILNQTFQDFELICVNDGSKDNSLEILNYFKEEDERIIVINQENQGVSTARNNAISIAKGKYIAFLDSDDLMHPTFLEKMHQIIEQENSDVVYCDYQNVPESCSHIPFKNYKELKVKSYNAPFQKYVNKVISVHVVIWNKFYKADIAKTIPFEKELSYAEDLIFTYLYLSKSKKITHLKQKVHLQKTKKNIGNLKVNLLKLFYNKLYIEYIKNLEKIVLAIGINYTTMFTL